MELESSMVISGLVDPLLTGSILAPTVVEFDPDGNELATNNVIRTDQKWQITIDWKLEGSLLGTPFFDFKGNWLVRVFLESMGTGTEYDLPIGKVGVEDYTDGASKKERKYKTTIVVGKDDVKQGIYKMVVAITYEYEDDKPGPIAGFHEGVMLQLYKTE